MYTCVNMYVCIYIYTYTATCPRAETPSVNNTVQNWSCAEFLRRTTAKREQQRKGYAIEAQNISMN